MKRFLLSLVAFIILSPVYSQVVNNLVVFCNDGEPFTLIMNGERYNMNPETKVRVTGLTLKKYKVKIFFTNPKLKELNTTLTFFSSGYECEFSLNKHGKKKYTMDYFTEKRIEGFDQINTNTSNNNGNNNGHQDNGTLNSNNNQKNAPVKSNPPLSSPTNTLLTGSGTIPQPQNTNTNSMNSCDSPIGSEQFEKYKDQIVKKTKEEDKKVLAIMLLENHCLLTAQVKELIDVFVEDNIKLDVAKKAYSVTKDYVNYSKLSEAFMTTNVRDDFKKFLSTKK